MLIIAARNTNRLLYKTFHLDDEKEKLIAELRKLAITAPLTNLFNRRYFNFFLPKEIDRAKRNRHDITLILIDIDNFRHPLGDIFLKNTPSFLKKEFKRSNDTIFRLGGDEFSIILTNQKATEVVNKCTTLNQKFIKTIAKLNSQTSAQEILNKVTISIGVAFYQYKNIPNEEKIINVADKALYHSKQQGKNTITLKEKQFDGANGIVA